MAGEHRFQATSPRLVLASASTARRALLNAASVTFDAIPAAIDEAAVKQACRAEALDAGETALVLARLKAERVAARHADALVIGCDQLLVCNGAWFDKPGSVNDAADQLRILRNQTHTLETAMVCLLGGVAVWHHLARPRLTMRNFSDAFLQAYLSQEGDAVLSSVGAYRLEGIGVHLFDRIEGEHSAILGLPLLPLLGFLRQHTVLID